MSGLSVLLQFAGAVALLLWSVRMVRRGMIRAFGADLRRVIARATRNRLLALGIGIGVTALLQSSTATALIVTSFVTRRLMTDAAAIAVILGANVGTTLVAQALSVPLSGLAQAFLLVGVLLFSRTKATRWHDGGRIAIGLGLMLLSLDLIVAASAPLRESPVLAELLASLQGYDAVAVLVATGLAWLVPSSLALILLVMSLVGSQVLPIHVALDLVLGINVGGTFAPLIASRGGSPEAQRAAIVNTGLKAIGCLAVLPLLPAIGSIIAAIEHDPVRQVVDVHTLFNLVLGCALLPFTALVARAIARLVPDQPLANDPGRPQYLDASGLESPSVALTSAAREALRMGDIVETMLARSLDALLSNDRRLVGQVERMDQAVDRLHEAIKIYVTRITREALDDAQGARTTEILLLVTNLEHVGDIVDKNLMEFARKKINLQQKLSDEGASEIAELHRRIACNLRLALGVFMSRDVQIARRLLDEKVRIRELELVAAERHFARLREGRIESIETSDLHLDILRELKRIHSHICSAAYPVLEAAGELRPTRLVTTGDMGAGAGDGRSADAAPDVEAPSVVGAMTPKASR